MALRFHPFEADAYPRMRHLIVERQACSLVCWQCLPCNCQVEDMERREREERRKRVCVKCGAPATEQFVILPPMPASEYKQDSRTGHAYVPYCATHNQEAHKQMQRELDSGTVF